MLANLLSVTALGLALSAFIYLSVLLVIKIALNLRKIKLIKLYGKQIATYQIALKKQNDVQYLDALLKQSETIYDIQKNNEVLRGYLVQLSKMAKGKDPLSVEVLACDLLNKKMDKNMKMLSSMLKEIKDQKRENVM